MTDDLNLSGLEQRHEPDPEFRIALHRRVVAMMADTDPSNASAGVGEPATIDLADSNESAPFEVRRARWIARAAGGDRRCCDDRGRDRRHDLPR